MLVKTNTTKETSLGSDFESMCISSDSARVLLAYLIMCVFLYVLLTFYPKKVAPDFTWSYLPKWFKKLPPGHHLSTRGRLAEPAKRRKTDTGPTQGPKPLVK